MAQFIAKWDAGYGTNVEVVDAETQEDAAKQAYELWMDEVQSNGFYTAEEITLEECVNFDLNPLDYGIHPTLDECGQYGLEPEDFGYEIDEDAG